METRKLYKTEADLDALKAANAGKVIVEFQDYLDATGKKYEKFVVFADAPRPKVPPTDKARIIDLETRVLALETAKPVTPAP